MEFLKSPLIFTGISGGGKTTLVEKLAQEYNLKIVDVFKYVKPYIEKYGSAKVKGDILKRAYEDLIFNLPNLDFDILEIASDWPDEFLPKIVEKLKKKPILIFCDTSLKTSLKRNQERNRKVPEDTLKTQAKFDSRFYKKLTSNLEIDFIVVDCEKPVLKSYKILKGQLKPYPPNLPR